MARTSTPSPICGPTASASETRALSRRALSQGGARLRAMRAPTAHAPLDIRHDDPRLRNRGSVSLERGRGWTAPWRLPYEEAALYLPEGGVRRRTYGAPWRCCATTVTPICTTSMARRCSGPAVRGCCWSPWVLTGCILRRPATPSSPPASSRCRAGRGSTCREVPRAPLAGSRAVSTPRTPAVAARWRRAASLPPRPPPRGSSGRPRRRSAPGASPP